MHTVKKDEVFYLVDRRAGFKGDKVEVNEITGFDALIRAPPELLIITVRVLFGIDFVSSILLPILIFLVAISNVFAIGMESLFTEKRDICFSIRTAA